MSANQNLSLSEQMELVKSFMKLTPEEKRKEIKRRTFMELRAVEMERREREKEKLRKEREEREQEEERVRREREVHLQEREIQEANLREERERKARKLKALQEAELEQLEQERLLWEKEMQGKEEPGYTSRAWKVKQQERQEKAGPCTPLKVGHRTRRDPLTPNLKTPEDQGRKKTLVNNWVGVPQTDSRALRDVPNLLLFAAKEAPKSEEKSDEPTSKPKKSKKWVPDMVKMQYWKDKYQDHKKKKEEGRDRKAEEQYARWSAYKASRAPPVSQQDDSHTGGNSFLKSYS